VPRKIALKDRNLAKDFYLLQTAYRLARDLGIDLRPLTQFIAWVYQKLRIIVFNAPELESIMISGEV
jgi:hypothetical protein